NAHGGGFIDSNSVYNYGHIVGHAFAHGPVTTTSGLVVSTFPAASAAARASGIRQNASGGSFASNNVFNHGTIAAFATASHANNDSAAAYGINQNAGNATFADNFVSNTGLVVASAQAHGTSFATAN